MFPRRTNGQKHSSESAILEGFCTELSSRYGRHEALPLDRNTINIGLKIQQRGPFEVATAFGNGFQFGRVGDELSERWHDHFFLVQQHTGQTRVNHQGRSTVLQKADCAILDSLGTCNFQINEGGFISCFAIPWDAMVSRRGALTAAFNVAISGDRVIGRTLTTMLRSLDAVEGEYDIQDVAMVSGIIASLLERWLGTQVPAMLSHTEQSVINRLQLWVQEHIDDPEISPDLMAAIASLSRRQLYRLFGKQGTTPIAWLWRMRLHKAHEEIRRRPQRKLTEIAYGYGFSDTSHFSKLYRREFGVMPSFTRKISRQ